jgi:hypothetical protein
MAANHGDVAALLARLDDLEAQLSGTEVRT